VVGWRFVVFSFLYSTFNCLYYLFLFLGRSSSSFSCSSCSKVSETDLPLLHGVFPAGWDVLPPLEEMMSPGYRETETCQFNQVNRLEYKMDGALDCLVGCLSRW